MREVSRGKPHIPDPRGVEVPSRASEPDLSLHRWADGGPTRGRDWRKVTQPELQTKSTQCHGFSAEAALMAAGGLVPKSWAPSMALPEFLEKAASSKLPGIMCVLMACDKGSRINSLLCRLNKVQEV